jgi:hypothetical protein
MMTPTIPQTKPSESLTPGHILLPITDIWIFNAFEANSTDSYFFGEDGKRPAACRVDGTECTSIEEFHQLVVTKYGIKLWTPKRSTNSSTRYGPKPGRRPKSPPPEIFGDAERLPEDELELVFSPEFLRLTQPAKLQALAEHRARKGMEVWN